MGVRVVNVEVSDRVLSYLIETGQLSEAETLDRAAIARRLAQLAEQAVNEWEQRTGRISTAP
jgi:hypothetical protein